MINMQELNYDKVADIPMTFLPDELELLLRGIETYMFIFHNIYSQHDDTDESWMRDFTAMNLYNKLAKGKNIEFKTSYDVMENCELHATRQKKRVYNYHKKQYKKTA